MEFQSKNLSSLLNSNRSIESYLSECTEYEKSNILEEAYQVDEGFGDWLKHKVAGAEKWMQNKGWSGKFFGMGQSAGGYNKVDRDSSRADIDSLASAQHPSQKNLPGDLRLNNIKLQISKIDPEFPNGQDKQKFLDCVAVIANAYDKLKKMNDARMIDTNQANQIIDGLRKFVHHTLDAELMGAYSHFNENKNYDSKNFLNEITIIERSVSGNAENSSTMKNLSSTKLQKALTALGASLGLASIISYLIGTMGPQLYEMFLENPMEISKVPSLSPTPHSVTISGYNAYIRNVKEILHASMPAHTGPWSTADLQNGLKDAPGLFDQLNKACVNASGATAQLNGIASGSPMDLDTAFKAFSSGGGTNKFGPGAIFALKPGSVKLVGTVGNLGRIIYKTVMSIGTTVTGASVTAGNIAAGLGAAAPFMAAGAGVALGGAALIHYLRSKGLKDSRAAVLRNTMQTLVDLQPSTGPNPRPNPRPNPTPNPDSGGGTLDSDSGMNDNLFRKLGPQALKLFNDVRQNRKKFINAAMNGHFKVGKRGKPIKMTPDQANQLIDFIKGSLGSDRTGGSARSAGLAGTVDDHELSYKDPQAKQRSNFIKTLGLNQGDTAKSVGQNAFRKAVRQGYAKNDPATGKLEKWTVPELGIDLTPDQYTKAKALQLAEELKKLKKLKEKILNELNNRTSMINESLQDRSNILKLQKQLKIIELHEEKINEQLTIRRWEKLSGILNG
jgi:hypothetical protein